MLLPYLILFSENQLILAPATELLKMCLDYRGCSDPLVTSAVLSSISALFVVATVTPEALMPILNQVFCKYFYSSYEVSKHMWL